MNKLLPCLDDIFLVINELEQIKPHQLNTVTEAATICNTIKQHALDALIQFELLASAQQIDASMINKSKFAIVAYIDELAAGIFANKTSAWINNPLQLEIFKELNAGEQFFSHLSQLRLQAEQYIDVLEIYYLFLELGYAGKYGQNEAHVLLQLKTELLTQIQHVRKVSDWNLFVEAASNNKTKPQTNARFSLKNISIAIAGCIAVYGLILMGTISYKASSYKSELRHYQQL